MAWGGQKGIAIMWPFLGPLVVDPNDPGTAYQTNPFTNPSSFTSHITPTVLAQIKAAGFDHVRLSVAPGPWIDAVGDAARTDYLFVLFDVAVDTCLSAGLGVMIDLHDTYYVKNMPPELLAGGTGSAIWQKRIQVTRAFASRYRSRPPHLLTLELFNEPLPAGSISGEWKDYLWSLYQVARTEMPAHTLILSAENYSAIDQLTAFDPRPYGKNVMWAIHPYIPAIYAIQGYPQSSYNKYVYNLGWPPNPAAKTAAIAAMTANVNADASLSAGQKIATIASQTAELGYFFDVPLDAAWIASELDKLDAWQAAYGLAAGNIVANEFGVTRSNSGNNGDGFTGAPDAGRPVYLDAMAAALDAKGFRRTVFALDAIDYGVTDGVGQSVGTFIMGTP